MNTRWFITGLLAAAIISSLSFAEPFALEATDDVTIANDDDMGPAERLNGDSGLHVRNMTFPDTSRRRVSFVSYDIKDMGQAGDKFFDVVLSVRTNEKDYAGPVMVWGVKEEFENFDFGAVTWRNAPGVVNNQSLNAPVELDYADLSDLLVTIVPAKTDRVTSSISPELGAFLNADTNNTIVLMFAESGLETCNSILRPIEYTSTGSGVMDPSGTEQFGVVLSGQIGKPARALDPVPSDGKNVDLTLTEVSWTSPEPNEVGGVVTCNVYFGDTEPNLLAAAPYGLSALVLGTAGETASLPPLEREKTYYWLVDVQDTTRGLTQGTVWTFNTLNQAPVVRDNNMGAWLNNAGDPATATITLEAIASDDDYPAPLSYLWKLSSGPSGAAVVIDPNDVESPTVVLPQTGDYVFQVTVSDSQKTSTGDVTVFVRGDACAAAQAVPGYTFTPADINDDCLVNMEDFAAMAEDWLICHSFMDAPCI